MVPVKLPSSTKEGGRGVGVLYPLPFGNLRLGMAGQPKGDFSWNFQILKRTSPPMLCRLGSYRLGGVLANPVLPHHRAYGSVHGGS